VKDKDTISAMSLNIKFMCMRLKNVDKGAVIRAFPSFALNTHKLYKKTQY